MSIEVKYYFLFSELNRELIAISEGHIPMAMPLEVWNPPSTQQSALHELVVILGTFACFIVTSRAALPQHLLVIILSHCPIFPFVL